MFHCLWGFTVSSEKVGEILVYLLNMNSFFLAWLHTGARARGPRRDGNSAGHGPGDPETAPGLPGGSSQDTCPQTLGSQDHWGHELTGNTRA